MNATGALGRYGEGLAARRLAAAGMTVLDRNWRCGRTGEIDIVARDKRDVLHLIQHCAQWPRRRFGWSRASRGVSLGKPVRSLTCTLAR